LATIAPKSMQSTAPAWSRDAIVVTSRDRC
jgi:hypothetical protein